LVSFYPHRGAVVSTLSLAEIEELFEIRALIEPDVLRRAIPRLSEEDLDRAADVLGHRPRLVPERVACRPVGRAQLEIPLHPLCAGRPAALDGGDRKAQHQHRSLSAHPADADQRDQPGLRRSFRDPGGVPGARRRHGGQVAEAPYILEAGRSLVECLQHERAIAAARKQAP